MRLILCCLCLCAFLLACSQKDDYRVIDTPSNVEDYNDFLQKLNIIEIWDDYHTELPPHLTAVGMRNPVISSSKATIGRVLFYDKNLSRDGSVACASCHKQNRAFADAQTFSKGIDGHFSLRNSSALGNVASFGAYYSEHLGNGVRPLLLWDNRAITIAEQSKIAFENPHEMGVNMEDVVSRVKSQPFYSHLFRTVYPQDPEPTEDKVLECLHNFIGAMGSFNSLLDNGLREMANASLNNQSTIDTIITNAYNNTSVLVTTTVFVPGVKGLSQQEDEGRALFVANCTKCHSPLHPLQEVFAACNGLNAEYQDQGVGAITGNPSDMGVFKSPSLRNIALTAPYMHDGRFKTLKEVIDFYSTGVKEHPNLHPLLRRSNGSTKLNLTENQKLNIVAFLETLSDPKFIQDKRFSNPFIQ